MISAETRSAQQITPESKTPVAYFRLKFADPKLVLSPGAQFARRYEQVINVAKNWADYRNSALPETQLNGFNYELDVLQNLLKTTMRIASDNAYDEQPDDIRTSEIGASLTKLSQVARASGAALGYLSIARTSNEPRTLQISDASKIQTFCRRFPETCHKLINPLAAVAGFAHSISSRPKNSKLLAREMQKEIARFGQRIDEQIDLLVEEVVANEDVLTAEDIRRMVRGAAIPRLDAASYKVGPIIFSFQNENLPLGKVIQVPRSILRHTIEDIVSNSCRAYEALKDRGEADCPQKFEVAVVEFTDEGDTYVDLIFDDNAIGYSDTLLRLGCFQKAQIAGEHGYGATNVESNGIGLATDTRDLEPYGIKIFPTKVIDIEGNITRGARTIIRIPPKKKTL